MSRVLKKQEQKRSWTDNLKERILALLVGVYTGIYISQNYQVPILPGPLGLWDKIVENSKKFEKKDKD